MFEKFSEYVIVSGYVAILLGRSRASEDVDILIPKISREKLVILYSALKEDGFWCYNVGDAISFANHLEQAIPVRISKEGEIVPNIELKFFQKPIDEETFAGRVCIEVGGRKLFVSPLEIEIPYKKYVLGSQTDLEDARHLEKTFEGKLDEEKLSKYSKRFKNGNIL